MLRNSVSLNARTWLLPDAVFDGVDLHQATAVAIEGGVVAAVAPAADLPADGSGVDRLPGQTLSPGFVDTHVHLTLGTNVRPYEAVMREDSDARMVLRSVKNALEHLAVGVTTVRDCGGRRRTTLELAEAVRDGLFDVFPHLQVSGRPITTTGGHFHWCEEEADGVEGVRTSVRRMLKDGADFIKIMASGGGTRGTWLGHASFTALELRAIVEESHRHDKLTTAHCLATTSIANAVEAGLDCIEHCGFQRADGVVEFDPEVGRRLVDAGIWYSPTVQTGYRRLERTRERMDREPDEATARSLAAVEAKVSGQLEVVARMYELGAKIVMGTDAIAAFGDYAIGLELHVRAGMTPLEALRSSTSLAAEAIGYDHVAGRIAPGRPADLVALDGDPTLDITAAGRVRRVWRAGREAATAPTTFAA